MKNIILSDYTENKIYALHDTRSAAKPIYFADCYIAVYIAHGSGFFEMQSNSYSISEGDILLINPQHEHKFIPDEGLRRIDIYCCCFSGEALNGLISDLAESFPASSDFFDKKISFIRAADTDNKEIRDVFIRMIDEQISSPPCSYNIITGYLPILLVKILRNIKTRNFHRIYSHNKTVDNAIRYIYSKLYSKVSLSDIAGYMNVSPSYLCRLFKKHIGMTTAQFVNMLRVEKMKDVLKNTDRPAANVTEMFVMNSDYLGQIFKREVGMTIQEYFDKYNYKKASDLNRTCRRKNTAISAS